MCTQLGTGAGGGCGHRWVQVQGWMYIQIGQVQEAGVHTGGHRCRGGCAHR